MGKTVAKGFQELCQRLEITDLQASTVSTRQQNVREAVKNGKAIWKMHIITGVSFLVMATFLHMDDKEITWR